MAGTMSHGLVRPHMQETARDASYDGIIAELLQSGLQKHQVLVIRCSHKAPINAFCARHQDIHKTAKTAAGGSGHRRPSGLSGGDRGATAGPAAQLGFPHQIPCLQPALQLRPPRQHCGRRPAPAAQPVRLAGTRAQVDVGQEQRADLVARLVVRFLVEVAFCRNHRGV